MSRTYIGPFGRILPILDGKEPEQQLFPVDETRTNMTTYQLPPPERLQFGSDTSPGFTEPMRYNTTSQSRKLAETASPMYSEQPGRSSYEQLPPVRQLFLSPSSEIQTSQYSPQHNANWSQRRSNLPSVPRSVPEQPASVPQNPYQGRFPQPTLPPHTQVSTSADVRRDDQENKISHRQPSLSHKNLQPGVSSYPAYLGRPPQFQYPAIQQSHQAFLANAPQSHQSPPLDARQSQKGTPMNIAVQYTQEHCGNYDGSLTPTPVQQKSSQAAEISIKPMSRVVGDADVPGQGPSWVYEDGTTCKKYIDGEEVNAQWGVTKAGKPRKRLAVACTTCREKKIKCDPAEPKCVQCEKFGRQCRFATAFRNQHASPETTSYRSQACTPPMNIKAEPSAHPSLPSKSRPINTEDQRLLEQRISSRRSRQLKTSETSDKKYYGHRSPFKKPQSTVSELLCFKAERKTPISKSCAQDACCSSSKRAHKGLESKVDFDSIAPLLSTKAELKIVDVLKARRDRVLRAIEQKCENDCQVEMKPCPIMLRLEIMQGDAFNHE